MSALHECECRICGNKMTNPFLVGFKINYTDPKFTGAAVISPTSEFACIKHGIIDYSGKCIKCEEEKKI